MKIFLLLYQDQESWKQHILKKCGVNQNKKNRYIEAITNEWINMKTFSWTNGEHI